MFQKFLSLLAITASLLTVGSAQADLFSDHPRTGSVVINGHTYPEPLYVQDADEVILYTLGDPAPITSFLVGTGYKPVTVGGKAIVKIFFYDYKVGDLPHYKEMIVSFDVTGVENFAEFPYVNAASVFVPGLYPQNTNFAYKLVLDNNDAIVYGKQVYGLDKYAGLLFYQNTVINGTTLRTEQVLEGLLPAVVTATTTDNPAGQYAFFGQLAQLLGGVPSFPPVLEFHSVTKDVLHPGQMKQNNYYAIDPNPQFNVLDQTKDFIIPGISPVGCMLHQLHLTPVLSYHGAHVQLVIELDPEAPTP